MYASKRSVKKAQGTFKSNEIKHNNGKITEGRGHRVQIIKDKHGFIVKQIVHYSPRRLMALQKYEALQKAYLEALKKEQGETNPEENNLYENKTN